MINRRTALTVVSLLLALLALIAATVWTGVTLREDVHELLGWTLLALVIVHIIAVIAMSLLTRENLVRAMITGTKPAAFHPAAGDARRPGSAAFATAAIVLALASYAVLAIDPGAFTPRSTEAFEHRMEAAWTTPAMLRAANHLGTRMTDETYIIVYLARAAWSGTD